jgi:hypothetical protein
LTPPRPEWPRRWSGRESQGKRSAAGIGKDYTNARRKSFQADEIQAVPGHVKLFFLLEHRLADHSAAATKIGSTTTVDIEKPRFD